MLQKSDLYANCYDFQQISEPIELTVANIYCSHMYDYSSNCYILDCIKYGNYILQFCMHSTSDTRICCWILMRLCQILLQFPRFWYAIRDHRWPGNRMFDRVAVFTRCTLMTTLWLQGFGDVHLHPKTFYDTFEECDGFFQECDVLVMTDGNSGISHPMTTSWPGNAFRITVPLWGVPNDHQWIPFTKGQQCGPLLFHLS